MKPLRVLIADDSPTVRAALVDLLTRDGRFTVVGEAADGQQAVDLAIALRPDLVTMDVLMPGLDGLGATEAIMSRAPTRVVVVASVAEAHPADLSMRAIGKGALEVVAKPQRADEGLDDFGRRVCEALRLLSEVPVVTRRPGRTRPLSPRGPGLTEVVGVVASTGGPPALDLLLRSLGRALPVPVLVAQHMTAGFTAGLRRWLAEAGPMLVEVARPGGLCRPGVVYLAPDGCHLEVDAEGLLRTPVATGVGAQPSGDRLLSSLALAWGSRAAGVVLTGMGEDGARGLLALRRLGGRTAAQDEASSVVYGMPAAALTHGGVETVLPLDEVASWLISQCVPSP